MTWRVTLKNLKEVWHDDEHRLTMYIGENGYHVVIPDEMIAYDKSIDSNDDAHWDDRPVRRIAE